MFSRNIGKIQEIFNKNRGRHLAFCALSCVGFGAGDASDRCPAIDRPPFVSAAEMSYIENQFESLWLYYYPHIDLHSEYKFHPDRRYRLDFAHLDTKIGIELNGQIWRKGGHSSGKGLQRDYEKLNLLSSVGWRLFCLSPEMINIENINLIAATIERSL